MQAKDLNEVQAGSNNPGEDAPQIKKLALWSNLDF